MSLGTRYPCLRCGCTYESEWEATECLADCEKWQESLGLAVAMRLTTQNRGGNEMIEQAIIIRAIALTVFWETAGEPEEGRLAVASVIWNRAGGEFAACKAVCEKPKQFSCWNRKNMNVPNDGPSRKVWRECRGIAERMADGKFKATIAATHYHNLGTTPYWAASMKHLKTIGRYKFYKEGK